MKYSNAAGQRQGRDASAVALRAGFHLVAVSAAVVLLVVWSARAAGDPAPAVTYDAAAGSYAVTLRAMHAEVPRGDGAVVHGWTYDGMVPGPLVVVPEGADVAVTMHNDDPMTDMKHGLDIHAAQIAPRAFAAVATGQSLYYRFTASVAGSYLYHCSSDPMLQHVANGMFGAFVVMPRNAAPARSYVIVQNEWYPNEDDVADMAAGRATAVTFNGQIGALVRHPLAAATGETVRFYVVNAGPSHDMAFHVVGAMLRPYGAAANALVQTIDVPPGSGVIVEARFAQDGRYPIVSHVLGDMYLGAVGYIDVGSDIAPAADTSPQLVR